MKCDNCGHTMIDVGSVRARGRADAHAAAYVCPTRGCQGYGAVHHPGNHKVQWPAMTLMTSDPLHARIAGAMKFKEALVDRMAR